MVGCDGSRDDGIDRSGRPYPTDPEPTVATQPPTSPPSSAPPPVGPPPSRPRPPLQRPREGRLIAGVAAGVAAHVGMDVVIVRILFVVATIFTNGFGIAAYALAWIFLPEEPADGVRPPAREGRLETTGRDPMFWVGIAALVLGVVWFIDAASWGFGPFPGLLRPDRGLLLPLVLIGFGVALWRASDTGPIQPSTGPIPPSTGPIPPPTGPTPTPPPSTSFRPPEETLVTDDPTRGDPHADRDTVTIPTTGPSAAGSGTPDATPPGFSPPPGPPTAWDSGWTPPPVPEHERSVLTRSTVGLALVTVGVLWLLRVADVLVVAPGHLLAASLLVVGLGLLVGSVAGRGRGLIGVGFVLLPLVLVAQLLHPMAFEFGEFRQAAGEVVVAPTAVEDLEPTYQVGAGTLLLDLSGLELEGDHELRVQVGFGEANVVVPADVDVEVSGQVGGGELRAFDRLSSGLAVDRTIVDEVDDAIGTLRLEVQVGFGEVTVRRAPASALTDR
jgi:phage shock protein PspC (stress-responsive transcriptional regulator)